MNCVFKGIAYKIIKLCVVFILILFMVHCNCVNADGVSGNPIDYSDQYKVSGEDNNTDDIKDFIGKILTVVNIVGAAVSVGVMALIGIRYIFGSVEEKADFKSAMYPYLIGAFFLFASTTVVNILYEFGKKIFQ